MASGDLIVRGDDGKLYRVSKQQLMANPVAPNDPAAALAPNISALAGNLKSSAENIAPYACVVAFIEGGTSGAPGKNG